MLIEKNKSLKAFNTFGIDAKAKLFACFQTIDDLSQLLSNDEILKEERLILGGGSNILLTKDFDGVVLKNELFGIELIDEDEDHYFVRAGAGENWHQFVLHCIKNGWAGIENLSLIPGCVGASPMQNIGAYGVEIKDRFQYLEAMNIGTLEVEAFELEDCEFGYRESIFKRDLKGAYIITSVVYRLNKNQSVNTSYGVIDQQLQLMGIDSPTIKNVSDAVIAIRSSKLPDPAEIGNSGSFFKNPVISNVDFAVILKNHPDIAHYPSGSDHTKVAAGWLIDQAGWKGYTDGEFGVHKNQALVLVNYGSATGSQIFDLSTEILTSIKTKYGIELEREVNII
ncbi:MAG: UDP-N-acetylmuramate dehydrogenase [Parvicellaceae bacterium]|jgi:UDP-N-acetylmuramate dehydrogenase